MDSETILKSHILDILFENRNKAYGAYTLRRDYNSNLVKSLLGLFILIMGFAAWQIFHKETVLAISSVIKPHSSGEVNPLPDQPKFKADILASAGRPDIPNPRLVDHVNPDTQTTITPTRIGDSTGIATSPPGDTTGGTHFSPADPIPPVIPDPPKPTGPATVSEIEPQFPGGIDAFIKFLKRNLATPRDLGENEETSVLVRFVVDTDGSLSRFEVTRSGGVDFDKEVLRVLHKMPKWIPGRTHGENISVYYTVPVKFTANSD